ncbi:MAG: hypothetical protein E6R03_06920 [Hyphomicrobiaceae bacterium]|nr:MAG: hypothetical protein E6R03_06920 [Hyphomicrobiaceae bacterium]
MNTPTQSDQVSRVLEPLPGESYQADDGVSPLMPFPTGYVLTREQEDELVSHAMNRLQKLENETGRNISKGNGWWSSENVAISDPEGTDSPQHTWMGKRLLFDKTYKNEMEWRPRLLGGIFAESNLVVPAARRITRQMIARAVNYYFGTDPWFAIYPVGVMDKERADKADRYVRWKMDQAKLKRTEEQAIERAFILGEAVIKTSWANRQQIYKTRATVLVDETGADIVGADGDYIMESDLWIQDSTEDPATGEAVLSDLLVLKRDGKTPQPEAMIWQEKTITRRITHYKGPEAKIINFMDFLCPIDAESVQLADCVVHLYDMPLMDLADQWKKSIPAESTAEDRMEATRNAIELLRKLETTNGITNTAQNSDTVDSVSPAGIGIDRGQPVVEIAEFYLRYDADGDGILEDVCLVLDKKTRTPIFYDYTANVTDDGLRPISVARVNEVPGRWYGIGAMEMFNTSQQIIDLWMNRKNHSNSRAARVDFWSPHNTLEGRANPNLETNWGGTYTPAPNKTAKDCLESVYLENNIGDNLQEMIEFFMQLMMNESGIANANDGNVAGMDSTKLATGIRNIEKSGQELFSLFLGHLEPGISESLAKMVKLVFSNIDQMEVYRYFEDGEAGGEGGSELLREINPGDIANIEIDTRVLLTRYRGEQILESYTRGWNIVKEYYAEPNPEVQARTTEFAQGMLKAMQVPNANKIIQPITMPFVTPGPGLPNPANSEAATGTRPRQGTPNL